MQRMAALRTIGNWMWGWVHGLNGLLALACLVYCLPLLLAGDQWGAGDWDQFTFRAATPRVALLHDGQLPLWNPYVNGGNVLLAHPHCPALSPWYLPVLLLGAPWGLRVQVLMFMILGTTGMAALLRRWGVSSVGCFTGGVLLMMSAHFALHITEGHLEWCVLGLMPWVVLCLVHAQRDVRFLLLGAVLLASALLDGSIYILAVFIPAIALWAVLESLRSHRWRWAAGAAAMLALLPLLGAVVLLPRMAFVSANPRTLERHDRTSPAALAAMLLDPRQADMFHATQQVRNPPDEELLWRLAQPRAWPESPEPWQWRRLDLELSTTSDWTDVQFSGVPYVMVVGPPEARSRAADELNGAPLNTEGLALQNPQPKPPAARPAKAGRNGDKAREGTRKGDSPSFVGQNSGQSPKRAEARLQATMYVRWPEGEGLRIVIKRGDVGGTHLTVKRNNFVLFEARHDARVPGNAQNARQFLLPSELIIAGDRFLQAWFPVEVTLRTTSDWCNVEVLDTPYLFQVEKPDEAAQKPVRLSLRPLVLRSPRPGKEWTSLRAVLWLQCPPKDDVRLILTRGAVGRSRLFFHTLRNAPLSADRNDLPAAAQCRRFEYVLSQQTIRERVTPQPPPWRWQLDDMGMTYDWHEYGCYLTWLGLAMALCGALAAGRRLWPLLATGLVAALVVLGATLPVSLWELLQRLPFYGSLQAPSRFLAVVVFVLAICGGYGIDRLGRWVQRVGGPLLAGGVQCAVALVIYVELALLGWNLFSGIFICPPRSLPSFGRFAERYADDDACRYAVMYSAYVPYLQSNSGVLGQYENIAIPQGKVRISGDPQYRGEAYLQASRGTSKITAWSMSRVKVAVSPDAGDRLVLNQNYSPGWKAVRRGSRGRVERLPAEPNDDGLISLAVEPGDHEVEFYYLPDSFLWGSGISALTLGVCLALLWGGRKLRRPLSWGRRVASRLARRWTQWRRSPIALWLAWAALLNLPFVLCHPGWPLLAAALPRSLAVNAVLFVLPGLPLVGLLVARGWLPRVELLWVVAASVGVFLLVLVASHLAGMSPDGSAMWNATWLIANLALLGHFLLATGGRPLVAGTRRVPPANDGTRRVPDTLGFGLLLFVGAYGAFFYGATSLVPAMEDHDYVTQGTGYGLLTQLKPLLVTDRHTRYEFAHPLLLHGYVAGSFLYFDQFDRLAAWDPAWQRVERAEKGTLSDVPAASFLQLPNDVLVRDGDDMIGAGATRHRIVGVDGGDYLIDPPLPKIGKRIPVQDLEVQLLCDDYLHDPARLASRTPNVFLSALVVALLGCWAAAATGRRWLGVLVALAYAASPEVFVRSSYGGYFAIDQFALLIILATAARWELLRSRAAWASCALAGGFAALADHKLLLLPAALVLWEGIKGSEVFLGAGRWRAAGLSSRVEPPPSTARSTEKTPDPFMRLLHPAAVGFVAGTMIYWAYGLAIAPGVFWLDHVRTHLVDRLLHYNPLGYGDYPTVAGLWLELWQHTGYLLLPLLLVAMLALARSAWKGQRLTAAAAALGRPGLWTVWMLLVAVSFSAIDWRQTKHLMPLLLPMFIVPTCWAAVSRRGLAVVGVVLACVVFWNLAMLHRLAIDFNGFHLTPGW